MAPGELILVNGFRFCHDHGDEQCFLCHCDHRMCNNISIDEELHDMEEFIGPEVEERAPLNVYHLGAVADLLTEASFKCEWHKEIDCKTCFDWVEIIKKEAKKTNERGRWFTMTSPPIQPIKLAA